MSKSDIEDMLARHIQWAGLPEPERERMFAPTRLWRFDFSWPSHGVAAEVDGGTWSGGRHVRGSGYENDCAKYNAATLLGWRVFRFTRAMVESGEALRTLEQAIRGKDEAADASA